MGGSIAPACVAAGVVAVVCAWAQAAPVHAQTDAGAGTSTARESAAAGDDVLIQEDPAKVALFHEAQALLDARKPSEAYELLSARELDLAGDPIYDYLLGVAALDSRRQRDAVFALERVVAIEPDFPGARMELGRALYELGELEPALDQFTYLRTLSPPPATRAVIDRYVEAIARASGAPESRWGGVLQFGGGYDSNANGSTDDNLFLGFELNPRNVETASGFAELIAGVGNSLAIGRNAGLVTNVQALHRWNEDASFIDQTVGSVGTTFIRRAGAWRGSVGANGYYGWLDGEAHDWSANLDLALSRRLGADWEVAGTLRGGVQQYVAEGLEVLDVDRYLGGLSLSRVDIGERSARVGVALIGGREEPRRDGSPYANDKYGARLFASALLRPQASVLLEVSALESDYDTPFFGFDREDRQYAGTLTFDIQNWPAAAWSLTPRVRYVRNDSSILLYEYDRIEAALFVRRSF